MTIDWWTLGLQAFNFLVLVWLLWRFLFKPVRRVIENRRQLAEQAFDEADAAKAAAEAEAERLRATQAGLVQERQETINALHAEMASERTALLDAAREDAKKLLDDARAHIADERRQALKEMKRELAETAAELAAALLRNVDASALEHAVLGKAKAGLRDLAEPESERLRRDLASGDGTVTVVTATPLDDAMQGAWRGMLEETLGSAIAVAFAVEPAILGGVELRFPRAVLRFTWTEQLRQATEAMAGDDAA